MANDPRKELSPKWHKAEIIFKAIASILIPAAIGSLGYFADKSIRSSEEREALTQIITEISNQRESERSAIQKEMLNTVLLTFTESKSHSSQEKAMALEMLAYHFNDSVHLKPIFAGLKNELLSGDDESSRRDIQLVLDRLEAIAKEINEKQLALLEAEGKKIDRDINLEELSKRRDEGGISLIKDTLELGNIKTQFRVRALDFNKEMKEIKFRLGITIPYETSEKIIDFWVGYFDFPSINNIQLAEDQRCSIVLKEFNGDVSDALITLVYFPKPYKSIIEKKIYETVVNEFRQSRP
jgi:hypothetical protein